MKSVNNKKTIRLLAKRSLTSSKGKSLVAILAIVLTTLMFTAFFTVGGSLLSKFQMESMRQTGSNAHSSISFLTEEEYDILKSDKQLKDISYSIMVGFVRNEELNKISTEALYFEDSNTKTYFCYPDVGSMPTESDEIVTSDIVLKALGIPCEVGEKVHLKIDIDENIIEQDFTLSGYYTGDRISPTQYVLVSKKYQEEVAPTPTKSALRKGPYSIDPETKEMVLEFSGRITADFNFYSSLFLDMQTDNLIKRCKFPATTVKNVNWAYVTSDTDPTTVVFAVVILLITFLSGYMIIYNIFYISVYTDIRHYGLLKTIGTTST